MVPERGPFKRDLEGSAAVGSFLRDLTGSVVGSQGSIRIYTVSIVRSPVRDPKGSFAGSFLRDLYGSRAGYSVLY